MRTPHMEWRGGELARARAIAIIIKQKNSRIFHVLCESIIGIPIIWRHGHLIWQRSTLWVRPMSACARVLIFFSVASSSSSSPKCFQSLCPLVATAARHSFSTKIRIQILRVRRNVNRDNSFSEKRERKKKKKLTLVHNLRRGRRYLVE